MGSLGRVTLDKARGTHRWRVQIRLQDGSPRRLSGSTKRGAREARRAMTLAIKSALEADRAPKPAAPPKVPRHFETFAREWLDVYPTMKANRKTTIESKRYHVEKRLIPYFAGPLGVGTLAEIDSADVARFVSDQLSGPRLDGEGKRIGPKTIANVLQTLKSILKSAVSWGELDKLPEFPKIKIPKKKVLFLTVEATEAVLSKTQATAFGGYALILCGVKTGPRAGELLGLTWDRVDFARNTITYDRQLSKDWKGEGDPFAHLVEVKAGARTVPMLGEVARALLALRSRIDSFDEKASRGFVHVGPRSGLPFTRDYLRTIVAGACVMGGAGTLSHPINPHVMRHTFASHLAMAGVSLQQIKEWLGHTSITTTMIYAHLCPNNGHELINRIATR